jgi:hypothetical protein
LGGPDLLGLGDVGEVVVLDVGQMPHQSGDRVRLRVDPERQLLRRQAVDHSVDNSADPAKGIDKQLGTVYRRLLMGCGS